jgi:hypothetical protein
MVFGPDDLAHYENFPLLQRHLKKTLDYVWMLVGPVLGVTSLDRFKKTPSFSELLLLGAPAS